MLLSSGGVLADFAANWLKSDPIDCVRDPFAIVCRADDLRFASEGTLWLS